MKTVDELFRDSFKGDEDDEEAWEAVLALRREDTDEVFQLAKAYSQSEVPIHRARALDVLAQLGAGMEPSKRPHFSESVSVALAHISEEDPFVVHSACWALAHLNDSRSVAALIEMRKHPDPDVRHAVAVGMSNSESPEAISTLIELMEDDNEEVRNWSTFGLAMTHDGTGRLANLDSNEIRVALRKRLNDSFADVRDEAIWGLAQRRDPSGLQLLLERLSSEERIEGDAMAAAEILDLKYDTPVDELLNGLRRLFDAR